MKDEHEKWEWLKQRLVEFTAWGSVLVFVTRKANSEEVATSLRGEGRNGKCVISTGKEFHRPSGYEWVWSLWRDLL